MTAMQPEKHSIGQPLSGPLDGWLAALNIETALCILIGVLAFALRFINLGSAPLSSVEAREALAVWRFVNPGSIEPVQPVSAAWFTLTSLVFALFGGNEFWARFWPMVAGTGLVFAPLVFRRELGRGAALAACAMLAISPALLAASRTADGTTLAAFGLLAALIGLRRYAAAPTPGRLILAGVGLGFGLAAGPRFISAALAGVLMVVMIVLIQPEVMRTLRAGWATLQPRLWQLLLAAGVTFVLVATAGLLNPTGLSAAGAAIPLWNGGWYLTPDTRPVSLLPRMLIAYEPLLLVLGLGGIYVGFFAGLWHGIATRLRQIFAPRDSETEAARNGESIAAKLPWRDAAAALGAAAIGALTFSLLYVGREPGDLVWVVLPLAMLSGKVIVETFSGSWLEDEWPTVIAQAGVLFVMLVFAYFQLAAYSRGIKLFDPACPDLLQRILPGEDCPLVVRLLLVNSICGLALFVTAMFALGWRRLAAARGLALAVSVITAIAALSAGIGLTQGRANDPGELWTLAPTTANYNLLAAEIRNISHRTTSEKNTIEIAVVSDLLFNNQDDLLGWMMRDFPKARFVDSLASAKDSPIVITNAGLADPVLGSAYVGAKFAIQSRALPGEPTWQNLASWWLSRAWSSEFSRSVILWVRADIHNLTEKP